MRTTSLKLVRPSDATERPGWLQGKAPEPVRERRRVLLDSRPEPTAYRRQLGPTLFDARAVAIFVATSLAVGAIAGYWLGFHVAPRVIG